MTYKEIRHNEEVNELLKKGNQNLGLLGYTDHSQAHCTRVAETAAHILKKFGYPEHDIELVKIAGYMHDDTIYSSTAVFLFYGIFFV